MAAKTSITVFQVRNLKFDQNKPKGGTENPEFMYYAQKTVNTLIVHIGQHLTPDHVQDLINQGHNVTIEPVK